MFALPIFRLFALLLSLACLAASPARANTEPSLDHLAAFLATKLPSDFAVDKVTVTASENAGSAVEPLIRQRFVAFLRLTEPRHDRTETLETDAGPVHVLRETAARGTEVSLFGIFSSRLSREAWATELKVENAADLSALGRPASLYARGLVKSVPAGPTAIVGSAEETAARDAAAARVARLQAEAIAKRAEQQTRLAGYVGQWSGAYVCRGQSVALRLVVETLAEDGTLSGRFEFSPLDGDRRTPSGSFAFAMTEDLETRVLTAKATDWINRPANYKMLDFTAEVRDQTRMVGKPSGSCTSLTVRKF
jgi:hypothetical protein